LNPARGRGETRRGDRFPSQYVRRLSATNPRRSNRKRAKTQDGRALRRYVRRWKVERLFAWLLNYRRVTTRRDRHAENFLGFVLLGCISILSRHF
jgi:transposase